MKKGLEKISGNPFLKMVEGPDGRLLEAITHFVLGEKKKIWAIKKKQKSFTKKFLKFREKTKILKTG